MALHIIDLDGFARGEAVAEDAFVGRDARKAQVAFERARVPLGPLEHLDRDADERRAIIRNVGRNEKSVAGTEEIDRAAAGFHHLVDAIDDDPRKDRRRRLVFDRKAELVQEGKHPLLFAFELVEFFSDEPVAPPLVVQSENKDQHGEHEHRERNQWRELQPGNVHGVRFG